MIRAIAILAAVVAAGAAIAIWRLYEFDAEPIAPVPDWWGEWPT